MKKVSLFLGVALLVAVLSTPAFAITLFPITDFKFTGHSLVYDTGTNSFIDQSSGIIPGIGDKVMGIGQLTGTVDPATGNFFNLAPGEEYTYMFGGYVINRVVGGPGAPQTQYFTVDPNSPIQDGNGNPAAWAVLWRDTPPDYNLPLGPGPTGNFAAWQPLLDPNHYPFADPSGSVINDGTPFITGILEGNTVLDSFGNPTGWLAGEIFQSTVASFFPPLIFDASWIHVQPLTLTGAFTAWDTDGTPDNMIAGSLNPFILSNYYGLGNTGLTRDVQVLNTAQAPLVNGYFNRDNDPATAAIVPEPATMLLLGSGFLGLAGFGRRRLRKKT